MKLMNYVLVSVLLSCGAMAQMAQSPEAAATARSAQARGSIMPRPSPGKQQVSMVQRFSFDTSTLEPDRGYYNLYRFNAPGFQLGQCRWMVGAAWVLGKRHLQYSRDRPDVCLQLGQACDRRLCGAVYLCLDRRRRDGAVRRGLYAGYARGRRDRQVVSWHGGSRGRCRERRCCR